MFRFLSHIALLGLFLSFFAALAGAQTAQTPQNEAAWYIQLGKAEDELGAKVALRDYAVTLPKAEKYKTDEGGFLIVIGPFVSRQTAFQTLKILKGRAIIPEDVRLVRLLKNPSAPRANASEEEGEKEEEVDFRDLPLKEQIALQSKPPESPELRMRIQTALQWFGHYQGEIHGEFDAETERAIRGYQAASLLPVTGALSDVDVASLILTYSDEHADLGFEPFRSVDAGIEIPLPMGQVRFDKISPPFLEFSPLEDVANPLEARVLLFSKTGTRKTLQAFFKIIKQFDFAETESARSIGQDDFSLQAHGQEFASYSYARLTNSEVKGFTIIFPRRYTDLMKRVGAFMRQNFLTLPRLALSLDSSNNFSGEGLLDDIAPPTPDIVQSGFYYTSNGNILTDSRISGRCRRIVVDQHIEASFLRTLPGLGTILQPKEQIAPRQWARFAKNIPWPGEALVGAGYSLGGVLGAPSLIPGKVIDTPATEGTGVEQPTNYLHFDMKIKPSDIGGPVFNRAGLVVGFLSDRIIQTNAAGEANEIRAKGHSYIKLISSSNATTKITPLSDQKLENLATDITVSVACWLN